MWKLIQFCVLLVLPPLISCSGSNASDDSPVIQIEAVSSTLLGVDNEFMFRCNVSSSNYTISLIIDGEMDSVKMERVTNSTDKKQKNTIDFTFSHTTAKDNGTTFMCGATNETSTNVATNFSDILTLQILYAPRFLEGNNETTLAELPVDKTNDLPCTVVSNPPVDKIAFTNTSSHFTNIKTKITKTSNSTNGVITFEKAKVENKGVFTCTATNKMGTTTLSYQTFVGGPPDKISIDPTISVLNGSLDIALGVNDMSDAPAVSLSILLEGIIKKPNIVFFEAKNLSVPVKRKFLHEMDTSIDYIEAGNYTLIIQAFNLLGNVTVVNETKFVPELSLDVSIEIPDNVTQGKNFTFMCKTEKKANFTVVVNSNQTDDRIVPGKMTPMSQEFTFTNTNYKDNGLPIQCLAYDRFKSPVELLNVLFPPVYSKNIGEIPGVNGTMNVTINVPHFASNPEPTKYTWMRNGKELKSSKRVTIVNATALLFNPLLQEDMGNYSITAENTIGKGNGTANINVLWPPYIINPVVIPTLKAGPNTTYEVFINISANPSISYTRWLRNGKDIINDTNISPGLFSMSFLGLLPKDNGSYSAIVYNEIGNISIDFDMMVLYPPVVKFAGSTIGTFLNTREVINVTINANPTNYTTQWMKDGKEIKTGDIYETEKDYLVIKNVSLDDEGNYTVKVTNDIGSATESFEISVYDGPFFKEGSPNSTVLTEIKTGSTVNMTCTIKKSVPPVTELRIEPSKGTNWRTVNDGLSSVTLAIDKASANNTRKFTCIAVNNFTTSTLAFNNYVGGVPNNMNVTVTKAVKDNTVKLTFSVTDDSDAPATGLLVYLKDTMKKNKTLNITNAPQPSFVFTDAVESKYDDLAAGSHVVNVYGRNLIGAVHLTDFKFTVPSNKPKPTPVKKGHKNTLPIALGVSIPLAVLLLCLVVAGGLYYYYVKRKRSGYSSLSVQQNGDE